MTAKSSENEMLVFGLCSTSDDQPSDQAMKVNQTVSKWPPNENEMKKLDLKTR